MNNVETNSEQKKSTEKTKTPATSHTWIKWPTASFAAAQHSWEHAIRCTKLVLPTVCSFSFNDRTVCFNIAFLLGAHIHLNLFIPSKKCSFDDNVRLLFAQKKIQISIKAYASNFTWTPPNTNHWENKLNEKKTRWNKVYCFFRGYIEKNYCFTAVNAFCLLWLHWYYN